MANNIDTELFLEQVTGITLPNSGSNNEYIATGYYIGIKPTSNSDPQSYKNNINKGTLSIIKGMSINDWVQDISLHEPDSTNKSAKQIYIKYKENTTNKNKICNCSILLQYNDTSTTLPFTITQEANIPQQQYITFKINWNNLQSINGFMNEFYGIDLCTSVPFWPNNGGTPPNLTQTNGTGSGTGGFVPTPGGDGVDQGEGGSNGSQEGNYYICTKPIYTNNTVDAIIPISNGYAPSSIKIPNEQLCYLIIRTSHIYVYKTIGALKLQPNATITIESTDKSFWTSST